MTKTVESTKLLIVDDARTNFLVLQAILKPKGYECIFEQNSEKVLSVATEIKPALILLDFEMPVLSGPQVCKLLRADPNTKDIPIIFVTSHADADKIAEAFDSGADDYVLKPVREKELLPRMHHIITNIQLQRKIQEQFEDQGLLTRVLSHDLNNYLSIVQMSFERITESLNSPKVGENNPLVEMIRKPITRANSSIERIFSLISNVKMLQSLADDKYSLKITSVNLTRVLNECQDVFRERFAQKNITFEVNCDPSLEVFADYNSLTMSVINNLVSNSIKFTRPQGGISVKATASGDQVQVVIADNGIGMDANLLKNVFSKSARTSRPGTQNEPGTGFGMPIVKRCMELYGGTIVMTSRSIDELPNACGTAATLTFRKAPAH